MPYTPILNRRDKQINYAVTQMRILHNEAHYLLWKGILKEHGEDYDSGLERAHAIGVAGRTQTDAEAEAAISALENRPKPCITRLCSSEVAQLQHSSQTIDGLRFRLEALDKIFSGQGQPERMSEIITSLVSGSQNLEEYNQALAALSAALDERQADVAPGEEAIIARIKKSLELAKKNVKALSDVGQALNTAKGADTQRPASPVIVETMGKLAAETDELQKAIATDIPASLAAQASALVDATSNITQIKDIAAALPPAENAGSAYQQLVTLGQGLATQYQTAVTTLLGAVGSITPTIPEEEPTLMHLRTNLQLAKLNAERITAFADDLKAGLGIGSGDGPAMGGSKKPDGKPIPA